MRASRDSRQALLWQDVGRACFASPWSGQDVDALAGACWDPACGFADGGQDFAFEAEAFDASACAAVDVASVASTHQAPLSVSQPVQSWPLSSRLRAARAAFRW
jgi:hypothetical protein